MADCVRGRLRPERLVARLDGSSPAASALVPPLSRGLKAAGMTFGVVIPAQAGIHTASPEHDRARAWHRTSLLDSRAEFLDRGTLSWGAGPLESDIVPRERVDR